MEGLFASLVLSTAITFSGDAKAGDTEDALKAVAKASYKQSGLDIYMKRLEKKYIPEEVRKYGGWAINIGKVFVEKKISYEWRF